MGLIVSKRIGNSPTRNRVKRMCREVFRTEHDFAAGFDVVVIARQGAEKLSLAQVRAEWNARKPSFVKLLRP
jgi:ribonuclease P protein component